MLLFTDLSTMVEFTNLVISVKSCTSYDINVDMCVAIAFAETNYFGAKKTEAKVLKQQLCCPC